MERIFVNENVLKIFHEVASEVVGEVAVAVTAKIRTPENGKLQRSGEGCIEIERPQDGEMFERICLLC